MNFLRKLFGKKQSSNDSNEPQGFLTFSSLDAAQAGEEMGEMYFQCPKCGTYERVNDIGKTMLKSDPNYFTSINCIECKHTYNARVRIQQGRCPGFDYAEMDKEAEERQKYQAEMSKIEKIKKQLSKEEMDEIMKEAREGSPFGADIPLLLEVSINKIIKTRYLNNADD